MKALVELHVHIEGTLEPEMTFAIAQRNKVELPYADVNDLKQLMDFKDLSSFLELYYECCAVLQTPDDFSDLMHAYLKRASQAGVVYAEIFFDPQTHVSRGVPIDAVIDGLLDGVARAHDLGISAGLIMCFLRDRPVHEALSVLRSVAGRSSDLLGVGLDSVEVGNPPSLFAEVFAEARQMGLRLVAHAGEEGPAEYVVEALDVLRVDRIDHGNRSLENPELVDRLRRERVPLTVCPLSNVRLNGVTSLEAHPLKRMLDDGLLVSVNSDDPAYFGGYIDDNFSAVIEVLELDESDIVALVRNGIESSFLSESRKEQLRRLTDDPLPLEISSATVAANERASRTE
ncbi:MAG: adenosine deaminase [Terrimesophilobacter sp.]